MNHTPTLLTDFYKTIHHLAYVPGMEYLTSYWTPRKTRIEGVDKVVMFGLQAYIKEFLIETFNRDFFSRPYDEIHKEYVRIISHTMNEQAADDTVMRELHELGYLPLEIKAVDEGTRVPISCPMIEFRNTVPGYGWLVNFLETPSSCGIWQAMTSATIGYHFYDDIVKPHFKKAVDDNVPMENACGDFSMRGMTSRDSAYASSAGHLLSFHGTATIGAIMWLEDYYNCDCEKEVVGLGTPSTEHSVMESYGKENEFECYRHLLQDVFPNGVLSVVSDTWDYWNVITNYLPRLKDIIMNRNGKVVIRGDSGDPVDIICGEMGPSDYIAVDGLTKDGIDGYFRKYAEEHYDWANESGTSGWDVRIGDTIYSVTCYHSFIQTDEKDGSGYYDSSVEEVVINSVHEMTPADKGTVELLWEIFGGKVNSKGYKVLDPHIGAIYGDSITPKRAEAIYSRLEKKGFAPNNCTLGIGSFTYQYVTRDSLGFALKATHCVVNGENRIIFKDPVTDRSKGNNFKKSQKGMCYVYRDGDEIKYKEMLHPEDLAKPEYKDNLLTSVFKDGKLLKDDSLMAIRKRLKG